MCQLGRGRTLQRLLIGILAFMVLSTAYAQVASVDF